MRNQDDITDSCDRSKPNRWISCLVIVIVLVIFLALATSYLSRTTDNTSDERDTIENIEHIGEDE
jgi:hypothetical protein